MLGIGRTHFENVRNHLATNGIIPRVHGNVKRVPRWKTNININITVATIVKNFLENYAEIHELPSPGRVTSNLLWVLKTIARASRKLWRLMFKLRIRKRDLCDTCQHCRNGLQYNARKKY